MAEYHPRVSDGSLCAAPGVAGGTRLRAGTLGSDLQDAAGIDPGDASAAGSDGRNIDGRNPDRVSADVLVFGAFDVPVHDHADVGAGAAYINGDHIFDADEIHQVLNADDTSGRSGKSGFDGIGRRLADGHETAVGMVDINLLDADLFQRVS